jgi:hypothetical protein
VKEQDSLAENDPALTALKNAMRQAEAATTNSLSRTGLPNLQRRTP